MTARGAWILVWFALIAIVAAAPLALAQGEGGIQSAERAKKMGLMPSVSLKQYTDAGVDSIRAWVKSSAPIARDRAKLYRAVRGAFAQHARFGVRVANTYPKNQLEWLLVTDAVADTLVRELRDVLEIYGRANPEEVLTTGRQLLETKMAGTAPPGHVLGLHVPILAAYAIAQSDTLLSLGATTDVAGLEDGFLRYVQDWCNQWSQRHGTLLQDYESRILQEDWIIGRLETNCGTTNWQLVEQYLAVVGIDDTTTPPTELYAHEFHLKAKDCDDSRVIYVDLPNFTELQLQMVKEMEERRASGGGPAGAPKEVSSPTPQSR